MPSLNTKLASAPNTTSNYVLKATSSTTIGNSLIQDDGTNVAIGTTPGTYKLNVSGTFNATGAATFSSSVTATQFNAALNTANSQLNTGSIEIQSFTVNNAWLGDNVYYSGGFKARNNGKVASIYFQTDGIEFISNDTTYNAGDTVTLPIRLKIKNNGRVGIGTDNPSTLLHLNATTTQLTLQNTDGGTNAERVGMFMTGGDTFKIISLNDNNTTRVDNILVANVLNGNVGVGASPNKKFEVAVGSDAFRLSRAAAGEFDMSLDGTGNIIYDTTIGAGQIFRTNGGSPRMTITSGGNVSIGTGVAAANSFNFYQNYSGGQLGFDFYNSSSQIVFGFNGSTQTIGLKGLSGTGNRAVYSDANGSLTNSSSDGTLKTNVTPIAYGLSSVLNFNPISFNWIDTENMGEQTEIGFIAQEIQKEIPELIGTNANGKLSLDYPKMVAVLAKAIQEQQAMIEAQQQQINQLINR